jgi:hypothetical protein
MAHPFLKIFSPALKKSTLMNNLVFDEAKNLIDKGYSPEEVYGVLEKFEQGIINKNDDEIVKDALVGLEKYQG